MLVILAGIFLYDCCSGEAGTQLFERMFEILTGCSFKEYVVRCTQTLTHRYSKQYNKRLLI